MMRKAWTRTSGAVTGNQSTSTIAATRCSASAPRLVCSTSSVVFAPCVAIQRLRRYQHHQRGFPSFAARCASSSSSSPSPSSTTVTSHITPLPHPPNPMPADSSYSSRSSSACSAFSSTSLQPPAQPPPIQLSPGSETWAAVSSEQLGAEGRIMLYASEIGGVAGLNPYKQIYEVFESVWSRTEPLLYRHRVRQVEQETGRQLLTRDQQAELLLEAPEASDLKKDLMTVQAATEHMTQQEVEEHQERLKEKVVTAAPNAPLKLKEYLKEYVVSTIAKAYGTAGEVKAIALLEKVADMQVTDNNRLFYGRKIGDSVVREQQIAQMASEVADSRAAETSKQRAPSSSSSTSATAASSVTDTRPSSSDSSTKSDLIELTLNDPSPLRLRREVWVGGRVDGFSSITGDLVELKNRTRRFMMPLPAYDRAQMEVYLQVCDRKGGELVERLRKRIEPAEIEELRQSSQKVSDESTGASTASSSAASAVVSKRRVAPSPSDLLEDIDNDFIGLAAVPAAPDLLESDPTFATGADPVPVAAKRPVLGRYTAVSTTPHSGTVVLADAEQLDETDSEFMNHESLLSTSDVLEEDPDFIVAATTVKTTPATTTVTATATVSTTVVTTSAVTSESTDVDLSFLPASASQVAATSSTAAITVTASSTSAANPATLHLPVPDFEILEIERLSNLQSITSILVRERASSSRVVAGEIVDPSFDTSFTVGAGVAELSESELRNHPYLELVDDKSSQPSDVFYLERLKRTRLERNDQAWNQHLLPFLTRFCDFLTRFLASPELQIHYLKCQTAEEKNEILVAIRPQFASRIKYEELGGGVSSATSRKRRPGTAVYNSGCRANGAASTRASPYDILQH